MRRLFIARRGWPKDGDNYRRQTSASLQATKISRGEAMLFHVDVINACAWGIRSSALYVMMLRLELRDSEQTGDYNLKRSRCTLEFPSISSTVLQPEPWRWA